jgi:hypothetical protein
VVVIPYNNSEDYRQLSVAVWVYCDNDSSCSDPCYLLAKKGSFALGLRSDEIAMAFHNKVRVALAPRCPRDHSCKWRPAAAWLAMDRQQWRMPAQTWTHVTVVYDSTYEQACTYANGRLVSTQAVKGKLRGSTQPLLIGVELKVNLASHLVAPLSFLPTLLMQRACSPIERDPCLTRSYMCAR